MKVCIACQMSVSSGALHSTIMGWGREQGTCRSFCAAEWDLACLQQRSSFHSIPRVPESTPLPVFFAFSLALRDGSLTSTLFYKQTRRLEAL